MGHCLPWILLLTYMCYLSLSVGAIVWTCYGISYSEYNDFPDATDENRNVGWKDIFNFLLVVVSCGTSSAVAASITLVGICSRSIFNTTLAIHGSLSLGILHMVMIILFLLQWTTPQAPLDPWSAEINGGFLGLCTLQVVLGIIHLKWQKNTWITLNLNMVFSLNSFFFIARTALTGYLLESFISHMLWPSVYSRGHQWPPWNFFFSAVSIATCIVVNGQCLLSVYFGSFHRAFAILSSFLLIVVCSCLSVVTSPYYISRMYNQMMNPLRTFIFSLVLSIVQLVHLILLVIKPNDTMCSLIEVMRKNLKGLKFSVNVKALTQQLQRSYSEGLNTKKKIYSNLISLLVSVVALTLIATTPWFYPIWSKVLLVSVGTSLLLRSLSAVLCEVFTHEGYSTAYQVLVNILEVIPLLVGAIGVFNRGMLKETLGGVALIGIYIIQFWQQHKFVIDIFKDIRSKVNEKILHKESETLIDVLVKAKESETLTDLPVKAEESETLTVSPVKAEKSETLTDSPVKPEELA